MKARVEHVLHRLADRLCAVGAVARCLASSFALGIVMATLVFALLSAVQERSSGDGLTMLAAIQISESGVADECGGTHASHDAHGCCAASSTCSPCLPHVVTQDRAVPKRTCLAIAVGPSLDDACIDPGLRPPRLESRA